MRKALSLLLAFSVVMLVVGCAGARKRQARAKGMRQLGMAKLSEGDSEGALADLTFSYDLNSDSPETMHFLGMAYWSKGRLLDESSLLVEGEKFMRASIKADDRPEWRNNLGALLVELGKYEEARKQCLMALNSPRYRTPERALNNIGKSYIEEGKYDKAIKPLSRALKVQPRACQVPWNISEAYKGLKRWDKGLSAVEKLVRICPSYPESYLIKAEILWFGKRDGVAANAALKKMKALSPELEEDRVAALERLIRF